MGSIKFCKSSNISQLEAHLACYTREGQFCFTKSKDLFEGKFSGAKMVLNFAYSMKCVQFKILVSTVFVF